MNLQGNRLTFLGHAAFRIETKDGATVYVDPWVSNPLCPENEKDVKKCDAIICTHGHGDHIGDVARIARQHNPVVVGIFELCTWLQKKGVQQIAPMNKGGTQTVAGVGVTMVHALHSSGAQEDDGSAVYAGEACGYVLELPGGVRLYHAGDTMVFGDMQIIHEVYAPEIALLPIGGHFTMGPQEAAYACKLLRPKTVIPMHFGTFPMLTGTPAELKRLLGPGGPEVVEMKPGQTI
ncbi:MAG TPA: metal-dependent hydrolase [Terriglobales bacterium]|nr:metal-dependent hydrolase [Terriglobales bacterium]